MSEQESLKSYHNRMSLPTSLLSKEELSYIRENNLANRIQKDVIFKDKLVVMSDKNFDKFIDHLVTTTSATSRAFALRVTAKALRYRTDKSDETLKASVLAIASGLYSYAPMEAERLQRSVR